MQTAADLANLEDATITVRHVNQLKEGRKNATLKDDDDNLWLVAPHKLSLFQAGATYKIEFNEWKSKDGVLFRKIENAWLVTPATPAPTIRTPALQTSGTQYYQPTSPQDKKIDVPLRAADCGDQEPTASIDARRHRGGDRRSRCRLRLGRQRSGAEQSTCGRLRPRAPPAWERRVQASPCGLGLAANFRERR